MVFVAKKCVLPVVVIFLFVCGCGSRQAAKKPYTPPVKIAVCFDDIERDGNKIVKKIIEGRKKKDDVDIMWYDAGNDADKQRKQIEKLAGQKVKAVVIQFVNSSGDAQAMRTLAEKKIKVIALENLPEDAPVDAYITSDHKMAGQLLARFAISAARKSAGLPALTGAAGEGGGGKNKSAGGVVPPEAQVVGGIPIGAVILSGDPGNKMFSEIADSARAALQESAEVRLLSVVPVGKDYSRVPLLMQNILNNNAGAVKAVLSTDSRLAMGAVKVLKSAGINNQVLTAGVGADEKSFKALQSGDHDAEVDIRPDLIGQYALDAAIDLARGGRWQYDGQTVSGSYSVPTRTTPVRLIQGDNAYLLKEQWKGVQGDKDKNDSGGGKDGQGSDMKESQGGDSGEDAGKGGRGKKTMLRITTQDGKTMEVQINGEVKKIESMDGGKEGQAGRQSQEQGQ